MRIMSLSVALVLLAPVVWARPSVTEIIENVDAQLQPKSDFTVQARITSRDPEQGGKIIDCVYYRRATDGAFVIVIASPETERGNGYVRTGDNLWMYKRATRTFTHIGRDQEIEGSNTSVGDVETRRFKDLYKPSLDISRKEIIAEEMLTGKIPVYRVEVAAKVIDVKYPKLVMWVTRDKFLELKRECYSLTGTLMETDLFTNYKNFDGVYVSLLRRFTDEVEKGRASLLEIVGISIAKVDDYKFDKSYLESLSK